MGGGDERVERAVREAFLDYMNAYFAERNADRTFARLSRIITGFGTGRDEVAATPGLFRPLYMRDLKDAPGSFVVDYHCLEVIELTPTVGVVNAILDVRTDIDGQLLELEGLRLSAVFQCDDEQWLLAHKHISFATALHDEGESYPLKALKRRNEWLEQRVKEKTAVLHEKNRALELALSEVKRLSGLLPICAHCKKVRNDEGYWEDVATYIRNRSEVEFSHGICPDCVKSLYPDCVDVLDKQREC